MADTIASLLVLNVETAPGHVVRKMSTADGADARDHFRSYGHKLVERGDALTFSLALADLGVNPEDDRTETLEVHDPHGADMFATIEDVLDDMEGDPIVDAHASLVGDVDGATEPTEVPDAWELPSA